MKRIALFASFLMAACCAAQTPYGRLNFQLQNAQGQAISGATVYVYAQSACGVAADLTNPATIYSTALGTALPQPVITDGFGTGFAYVPTGCYTEVYNSPYTGTTTLIDQNAVAASVITGGPFCPLAGPCTIGGTVTAPLFVGPLTGHASLDLPLTGGTITGPLVGTSATFSLYVDSPLLKLNGQQGVYGQLLAANGTGTVFAPSRVFSLPGLNMLGDSITQCVGTGAGTANSATCYATMLQSLAGAGGAKWSVSGSYAADMAWQAMIALTPTTSGNIPTTILCCTNDAYNDFASSGSQTTGRQANALHALTAIDAWATIPQEFKISGANYLAAGCTTGGTVEVSNYGNVSTILLESVGAFLTCPTLQSGPQGQYFAWMADSSGTATASFSLDSGAVTDTWANAGYNGKSIGTTNNPVLVAPIATRYAPISSGAHTFTVTCTANCTTQGGIIGGIYIGGATASGTPGNTCIITFSNGGTATVPIAPNGLVIATEIPLTITAAGSAITGNKPTTGTVSNGTASNCAGTASVLTWTRGPFSFAFQGSPVQGNTNLGNHNSNPPSLYLGGTIRAQQAASFSAGTGAQMNPYADTYNTIVQTVANQLYADSAYSIWVDVRSTEGLDYATLDSDMQAANLPNGQATIASTNPGLHPNGSIDVLTGLPVGGQPHIFAAFAAAMQLASAGKVISFGNGNTVAGMSALPAVGTQGDNTAYGNLALGAVTTGTLDTAVGSKALQVATTGSSNVAVGRNALGANTTGGLNTAIGTNALSLNVSSGGSTAVGNNALVNSTAANNTAVGSTACQAVTTGGSNTCVGQASGQGVTTGANNTAVGFQALQVATTGNGNTALGDHALSTLTTPSQNTGVGKNALTNATTGANNSGSGYNALAHLTTGTDNAALGLGAGDDASDSTGPTNSVFVGSGATYTGASPLTNVIVIGKGATTDTSNTAVIGNGSTTDTYFGSKTPATTIHVAGCVGCTAVVAPVYTYDTCTAGNCANLSANQGAQTMVGSVPGSNGAYYTFKGELTQTALGTGCATNSVQLQITFTDLDTNASGTSAVTIQTGATAAPNLTCTTATAGSLIKCRFSYPFVAKSGTAITWNTANYTATSCSPNWTYTVRPLLTQDYQMQ